MDIDKYVIEFLLVNGFKCVYDNEYENDMCKVVINTDHYEIVVDGGCMYSRDLNIYWLVGLLTWNGYISKNYKK